MNDEILLVKEILAGKKENYKELVDRYKDSFFSVAFYHSGDKGQAENIVLAFLKKLYVQLPQYSEMLPFSDWISEQYASELNNLSYTTARRDHKSSFHNPSLIKLEESIQSLPSQEKLCLLLVRILGMSDEQISRSISMENEKVKAFYERAMEEIRTKALSEEEVGLKLKGCFSLSALLDYKEERMTDSEATLLEEHLEFCPHCRNVLSEMQREEERLDEVLLYPKLMKDTHGWLMQELSPYKPKKPKHKTWKYQLSTLGIIGAVVLAISFIYPNLQSFSASVKTFIEHGTIYNVWAEGTYAVTDKEITFEVTEVEMDQLYMLVYYEVKKGEEIIEISPYEDMDFYSYNPLKILDEEGKQYPIQLAHPEYLHHGQVAKDVKDKFRPHILIHLKEEDKLPDEFTLQINLSKLRGQYGDWDINIPIRYDKVEKSVVKVDLNEKLSFGDKLELELLDITYGKYGAKFRYQVNQTEKEKDKIMAYLKEQDQEHRIHEFMMNHHIGLVLVTKDDQHLVPVFFHPMDAMYDPSRPVEMHVSNYYMDKNFHEVKGKLESLDNELYAEIYGTHYSEPAFFSMEIPFEETEGTSLNSQEINGIELIDYQLRRKEEGKNRYEFIIRGDTHDAEGNRREVGWHMEDQNGSYVPVEGWYHQEDAGKQGVKRLFHGEIIDERDSLETLRIRVDYVYSNFDEHVGKRFPLFSESDIAGVGE